MRSLQSAVSWVLLVLVFGGVRIGATSQAPEPAQPPTAGSSPWTLIDALEEAWRSRDLQAYLALWSFDSTRALRGEASFASRCFAEEISELRVDRPGPIPLDQGVVAVSSRLGSVTEPRARFEQWLFVLERHQGEWRLAHREGAGQIDGLIHLDLDPRGFRADGLRLALEDFELRMDEGTLFVPPTEVGATALVFVGKGSVRFSPAPDTERLQLTLFCGEPELRDRIRSAFVRINPGDLERLLRPEPGEAATGPAAGSSLVQETADPESRSRPAFLRPDPESQRRWKRAREVFEAHVGRAFVLDAPIAGSPWWVLPGSGDASVTFETEDWGSLTLTVNGTEPESISLFDRDQGRQLCLYPAAGRSPQYSEDDGRGTDVLHHDLQARFDPRQNQIEAVDTLTLEVLSPTPTLRLQLAEPLSVDSVTSDRGGDHLFFRVRNQNALLVPLGYQAGQVGRLSLTVRYRGSLAPVAIEDEQIQMQTLPEQEPFGQEFRIEPVRVYSSRTPWYPRPRSHDYATASLRLDVPKEYLALAGGKRTVISAADAERHVVEYQQSQPGKYIAVAVGRLERVGGRRAGVIPLEGFSVPRSRGGCQRMLEQADEMLAFFTQLFGPVPYPSLRLALIEGPTPGGHSPPGMALIQERPAFIPSVTRNDPADFSRVSGFFLAHELAHQWWGHGIAGQNYHERWLSEAMAQYAAALWARSAHGEDTFRDILERLGRFAQRASSKGPLSLGYRLGHIEADRKVYRAVVYNKGAYVLHMIRGIVGDQAFRRGLTALQERHRFQKVGARELQAALEEASGEQLGPYFRAWVDTVALPKLTWSSTTTETAPGYRTEVTVQAEDLPGTVPLELAVVYDGGREVQRVSLPPSGGSFQLDTPSKPDRVLVNDDLGLLAEVREQ